MPQPTLSVLLPAHNAAAFVTKAITSTLRALPSDAELLVKDDGSTDATRDLVKRIDDSRVRLMTSDTPAGVANSLNELAENARGQVLARMDADDICLPWRFRIGVEGALQGGVAFSSALVFGNRLYRPRLIRGSKNQTEIRRALLADNFLTHPTALISRRAFEMHGGYRPVSAEDYDLWLRLAATDTRFHLHSMPTLLYRHHSRQASRATNLLNDRALAESWSNLFNQLHPNRADHLLKTGSCDIKRLRSELLGT